MLLYHTHTPDVVSHDTVFLSWCTFVKTPAELFSTPVCREDVFTYLAERVPLISRSKLLLERLRLVFVRSTICSFAPH